MRSIDWIMYSRSGFKRDPIGMILQMRLVAGHVSVDGPKLLDLFLRRHFAIVRAEDADLLASLDLQQEITFTIDMICRQAVGGGYENNDFLAVHVALKLAAADFEKAGHAIR